MHIVFNYNGSVFNVWRNGELIHTNSTSGNYGINGNWVHRIGKSPNGDQRKGSHNISQVYFIDGQALDASYFGFTDPLTNTWRPKKLSSNIAFGTNGFYLPFDGSAPIGQDQSGRGNNWTPVNFGGSNTIEKATGALPILNTDGGGKVARVGVRTDANASSLVLALPLVGIKSDFSNAVNSGTSNKAVTNNGTVTFPSTYSNFYGGSAYLQDTSSQNLTFTNFGSDFQFPGDYTIECWVYPTTSSATDGSLFVLQSGGAYFAFNFDPGTQFNIYNNSGGASWSPSVSTVVTGQWNHLALVRSGSTQQIFVNGVSIGTNTASGTHGYSSPDFARIGGGAPGAINSYIQDFRIYKGLAKYTSNFIPASTDPDIVPDSPSGVSYSSNVALVPSTDGAVAFDGSGDYLTVSKTNAWPTGTQDATIEFFLYRNGSGSSVTLFGKDYSGAGLSCFYLTSSNVLYFYDNNIATTGGNGIGGVSIAQSKWYHIALTRSGSSLRLFLDGQLIDSNLSASGNWYDSGSISYVMIGARENPIGNQSHNGFISNSHVVFDTALYTSNFTPPTAGISSVANTKLLCCKSNSSATAADVTPGTITANGNAAASNFNPFTVNINTQRGKQSGYATWDPLAGDNAASPTPATFTNGNLTVSYNRQSSGAPWCPATIAIPSSGKWYWEFVPTASSPTPPATTYGICSAQDSKKSINSVIKRAYYLFDGQKISGDTYSSYASGASVGDTIGIAVNMDSGVMGFYKNGIYLGNAFTDLISSGYTWVPFLGMGGQNSGTTDANFGQKPFKFPPPAGFQPLTLANTPRPTIVRPDQYVGVTTYIGTGATRSSIIGFKPDFLWIKERTTNTYNHHITDSVRGVNKRFRITASTEFTSTDQVTSYNSNGFTLGADSAGPADLECNQSGKSYVAWAWKAGGNSNTFNINDVGYATASAAGLTAGTITPTGASVNTKSGFSIIKVPGTASAASFSHGLGQAPAFVILKETNGTGDWQVGHKSLSSGAWTSRLGLNLTTAEETTSSAWNNTPPTSSLITVGATSNVNNDFIVYAWAEIPGFSKFGSYTGTGGGNPFVHLGFRPRWLLVKRSSASGDNWWIIDSTRNTFNVSNLLLYPSDPAAETSSPTVDFVSNGFVIRSGNSGYADTSGSTYIYCAFAETPSFNLYGAMSNAR
jgi:hypothetical protein